jgi:hypothetical protein
MQDIHMKRSMFYGIILRRIMIGFNSLANLVLI